MISHSGNKNFLVAHYDWLVLGVGIAVLAAGAALYVLSLGNDPDESAAAEVTRLSRLQPRETGVKGVDMTEFQAVTRLMKSPAVVTEVSEREASFLASEQRVLCECGKAIPGDTKLYPECPYCQKKQKVEPKVVLDADGDGLPDEWERKYGLNPNDPADAAADGDKDDFTNLEEYQAKTDPTDRKDHPDYLDSLTVKLPLKATYMPFVFLSANKIPTGWRCTFFDAKQKDDYGRAGRMFTPVIGEEVGKSGYVLKGYEKKEERRAIKGGQGLKKAVDVSEATLERKSDGKVVKLTLAENKLSKPISVDVQASLNYVRGNTVKDFAVVAGDTLTLSGEKYKVGEIKAVGKGAEVTLENLATGKKRTLQALEQ